MRILPIRTISGRIVLGFFVLLCTFGALGGYAIVEMAALSRDLKFIRRANLELLISVVKLQTYQNGLIDELKDEQPRRSFVRQNRVTRRVILDEIRRNLAGVTDVPTQHAETLARTRDDAERVRQEFDSGEPVQEAYIENADRESLLALRKKEDVFARRVQIWVAKLRKMASDTTARLESAERQTRLGAIVLGAVAGFVGLLVTLWSVLTVRPIKRLRDGARRVAQGEYRERVEVVGDTEVAEVAREFNAMAAAIEEREGELVRQARLAAVGKMAAIITHEIRNPLSSIGLNAELLEDELAGGGKEEAVGLCRKISKEVDRLTAITEEYLRFARLPRPKLLAAEVNEIVTDLVQFQKEELGLAGVQVTARLGAGLPLVSADEGQLRQALLNLVRNAADAMAAQGGGTLEVETRAARDGAVEVAVADSGPGIAAELLPRIFEPFFSTKEKGTGLGLALTQQIVVEHGGRLEVDSRPGHGTTFVVRLPPARAA
jgi:two-component system, NtrC family, sensor kinase